MNENVKVLMKLISFKNFLWIFGIKLYNFYFFDFGLLNLIKDLIVCLF